MTVPRKKITDYQSFMIYLSYHLFVYEHMVYDIFLLLRQNSGL